MVVKNMQIRTAFAIMRGDPFWSEGFSRDNGMAERESGMEFHRVVIFVYLAIVAVSVFGYFYERLGGLPAIQEAVEQARPIPIPEMPPGEPEPFAPIKPAEFYASPPLHKAVALGNQERFAELTKTTAWVNRSNGSGQTPLFFAVRTGREEFVKKLLDMGATVDWEDNQSWTPLFYAIDLNHTSIIELLVRWRADYLRRDAADLSPLHLAARSGNTRLVRFLLENGADVNIANSFARWTPLHYAARGGHTESVRLLLQYGADSRARLSHGWMPIDLAAGQGHREVVNLLSTIVEQPGQAVIKSPVEVDTSALRGK